MTEERLARVILEWWRSRSTRERTSACLAELCDHHTALYPSLNRALVERCINEWSHDVWCVSRSTGSAVGCDCGVHEETTR